MNVLLATMVELLIFTIFVYEVPITLKKLISYKKIATIQKFSITKLGKTISSFEEKNYNNVGTFLILIRGILYLNF